MKERLKTIAYFVAAWLFVAVLAAAEFWPRIPRSFASWALLIVFGPLLYVAGELASEWFWSSDVGHRISQPPSLATRISVGVAVGMVLLICSVWLFS